MCATKGKSPTGVSKLGGQVHFREQSRQSGEAEKAGTNYPARKVLKLSSCSIWSLRNRTGLPTAGNCNQTTSVFFSCDKEMGVSRVKLEPCACLFPCKLSINTNPPVNIGSRATRVYLAVQEWILGKVAAVYPSRSARLEKQHQCAQKESGESAQKQRQLAHDE